jgi:hypothetical protein
MAVRGTIPRAGDADAGIACTCNMSRVTVCISFDLTPASGLIGMDVHADGLVALGDDFQ